MNDRPPVSRSSLVPVLGCIAIMLFGMNFYRFLDRDFISKWRICDRGPHQEFVFSSQDGNMMVFEFDEAHQDRSRALRALKRNLKRAMRDMERARSHRGDVQRDIQVDLQRLQEDIEIKQQNLERLEVELRESLKNEVAREAALHERNHVRIRIHR